MSFRKRLWYSAIILLLSFYATVTEGAIPPPSRIGGSVMIDTTLLTQATDDGYTFVVTKQDGTPYLPKAEDTDGLSCLDFYIIDIPIYDEADQPGGANPGDIAVIHVYKDGTPLAVLSPQNGKIVVGDSASTSQIDLIAVSPSSPPEINSFTVTPASIKQGDFVILSWDITGADSASIDNGVGSVVPSSGSVQDAPTFTTTYTLRASNDAGSVIRQVTVRVDMGIDVCEGDFDTDGDLDGTDLSVFLVDFGRTDCKDDCEGDFDSDGDVDGSDLAVFSGDFGRTDCLGDCQGDFDYDNDVDGSDLAVFAADFGRTDCKDDCEGDFNTDGDVDGSDLAVFLADFGRTDCPGGCRGDFDHDSDVDGSDLAVFAADFGRTDCGSGLPCEGNFDGDGDVDGSDLAVFAADFGRTDCP